jgi:hypothetical protein
MDLFDFDQQLPEVLASPSEGKAYLLCVLTTPDEERAAEIGRLHQEGRMPSLAELLIDLEEGPDCEQLRAWVAAKLRRMARNG